MKIYDSFLFFNELDLLEIRLNILDPYVDYFVISECDHTFSGNKKEFFFEENIEKFSKFLDKIIYVKNYNSDKIEDFDNNFLGNKKIIYKKIIENFSVIKNSKETDFGKPYWCRDYLHREYVGLGLSECKDEDIIIFGDLDEIPNPEVIKNLKKPLGDNERYCLYMDTHNYFVNNIASTNWAGSIITKYKDLKTDSLCLNRKNRFTYEMIKNAGWHLSFMGGYERIKYKIESYGHQEFNSEYIKSNIDNKIKNNVDIFNRSPYPSDGDSVYYYNGLKKVDFDSYYPDFFKKLVKDKFSYLIKND